MASDSEPKKIFLAFQGVPWALKNRAIRGAVISIRGARPPVIRAQL
jgi:hypothetical protein